MQGSVLLSVVSQLTVKQFKEHIASSVEIPVDKQRLIYQGRVLQDDRTLTEYSEYMKLYHRQSVVDGHALTLILLNYGVCISVLIEKFTAVISNSERKQSVRCCIIFAVIAASDAAVGSQTS